MTQIIKHLFTPQASNNHRPKLLHLDGLGLLSALLLVVFVLTKTTSTGALPSVLGFASSITISQVVAQTNAQRATLGVSSLTENSALDRAAAAKGNNMCADQYWAHISPSGVTPWVFIKDAGYQYAVAGENLARDFSDTPSMISAWMASPTHRANVVNERYRDIGVAVVDCKLLGSNTTLVVQMFGSQLAGAPTTSVAGASTQKPLARTQANANTNQVAGEQSVPALLANANPSLQLETPPPAANPTNPRFLSPLQVIKAVMISMLLLLILVLFVDLLISEKRQTVRLVGKNLAHILFLAGILLVVLIIKVGII